MDLLDIQHAPSRRPNLLHIPQLVLINTFVTIRGRTFPGPNGTITKHSSRLSKNGSRRPFRNCICCTPPDALDSCCCPAPSASESSAPGYSRPIHALLLGCAAQSSAVPGCSAPPKRESPQVTTEPALRICSRGLRSDDSWKLHISQLSLADAAISAAVRSAPGHHRSIAKQCGICPLRCLDVLHIPQLLLDSSAISATASIAQVSPDPSPSSAANARSDARMYCAFPSCPSTSLLSAPARRAPQVTQTHLQGRQPMRLPKLGCAADSQKYVSRSLDVLHILAPPSPPQ